MSYRGFLSSWQILVLDKSDFYRKDLTMFSELGNFQMKRGSSVDGEFIARKAQTGKGHDQARKVSAATGVGSRRAETGGEL
jgi:hypothetical protein